MATPQEIQSIMKNASKSSESETDLKTMMEEIKRLRIENDDFKKRQRPVTFTISEKGAVSINGIGKFPFSLYKQQWERILEKSEELKTFMEEHKLELN